MTSSPDHQPVPQRSPIVVALLSAVWPGLGHAYIRRWRAAALFAVPPLLVVAYLAFLARGGIEYLAADLFVPSFAFALIVLAAIFVAWRLAALGHAWLVSGTPVDRRQPRARVVLGLLAVLIVGSQALIGYYAWAFYDASSQIFEPAPSGSGTAAGSTSPGESLAPSASPSDDSAAGNYVEVTPVATPATPSSRINVLVTGIDAYRTRSEALNDTLLVISVDPATNTAVMISIPRDTSEFQMYSGGVFHGKINSLMTAAYNRPSQYPDGPVNTLTKEVGFLLGIPIHYYAAIALAGFRQMIDLVGGVDVVNPKPISDPLYDWLDGSPQGFFLTAGPHHLDGRTALAYVRSRQGQGDNDYTRSARQQQTLLALKSKLVQPAMIARLPQLLAAAARTIKTDFPPERVGDMLALGKLIPASAIQRFVLGPPYNYHPDSSTTGGVWTSRLKMDLVAQLSIQLFGSDSAYSQNDPYASPTPTPSGP